MINCSYSNPVNSNGTIASSTENFQFASSTCLTVTDTISTTTDIAFTNEISAGSILEILFIFMLTIIILTSGLFTSLSEIPVFLKRKEK